MTISLPGSVRLRPHPRSGFIDVGASAGAAAPFNPLTLSPALWLKADAGTSTTTDGVAVSSWADQSGNSRNASQGTAGSRPVYKTAILNGLPVLRFDGVDDYLDTVSFTQAQPDTIFMVWAYRYVPGANNTILFDGLSNRQHSYVQSNGQDRWYAGNDVGISISGVISTNGVYLTTLVFNGASSTARINGVDQSPANPGALGISGGLRVAGNIVASAFGQIDLGELLIVPGAAGTTDRTNVETYLKAKWGTP